MARRLGLRRHRFREAQHLLQKERCGQRDVYTPLSRMGLEIANPLAPPHERYRARVEDGDKTRSMTLAPTALAQLATMAGIPGYFLNRVPPALGLKLLRCLLELSAGEGDKTCLVRLKEDDPPRIRAVLPASFVRVSDCELLEDLERAIERPVTITDLRVDEDVFAIRMIFAEEGADIGTVRHADPTMPGLDLRSSETGVVPLQIRRLLFREICSNGMTAISDSQKLLMKRMTRFNRGEFRLAVRGATEESVEFGKEMAGRLRASRSDVLKDPGLEVERVFRNYKLGSVRGERARWVFAEMWRGASLFGIGRFELVQAFTAVARGLDHDRRLQWEDAMTDYLLTSGGGSADPAAA